MPGYGPDEVVSHGGHLGRQDRDTARRVHRYSGGETSDKQMTRSVFVGEDYVVEAYGQQVAGGVWGIGVRATDVDNLYFTNLYEDLDDSRDNVYTYWRVGGSGSAVAQTDVGLIDLNTWYQLGVRIAGTDIEAYLDGSLELQGSHSGLSIRPISLFGEANTVAYYDDVRVRKYAATEPTAAVSGEETPRPDRGHDRRLRGPSAPTWRRSSGDSASGCSDCPRHWVWGAG